MKFIAFPYGTALTITCLIVSILFVLLSVLGTILLPNGRIALLIMSGLGLSLVCLVILGARGLLGRVSFDELGVWMKYAFRPNTMLAWDKCIDIGVAQEGIGTMGINQCALFFSTKQLSLDRMYRIQKKEYDPNEVILIIHRDKVLEEVLKYIDKERIRNLHLLEK